MTVNDILKEANKIANSETYYVRGCDGILMTQAAKLKYTSCDPFNAKRTKQIFALSENTIGFDEFSFFNHVTEFKCRNIGDVMSVCHDISKDFSNIVPGEVVFMGDRFGIFAGNKKAIAVSPNGVGYTILKGWVSHGRINGVDYEEIKDDKEEVGRVTEGTTETEATSGQIETDVEVRPSGIGGGDRVLEVSPQAKSYDRSHGRRRP